jgi:small basic protein
MLVVLTILALMVVVVYLTVAVLIAVIWVVGLHILDDLCERRRRLV